MMLALFYLAFTALTVFDCTQAVPSVAGGVTQTAGTNCPRYPTRYEGDALVIEIEKGECEMVIASVNIHKENADKVKSFRKRVKAILKKVNVPTVSFRPLLTISEVGSNSIPNDATGTKAVDGNQPTNKDTTADSQLTTGTTVDVKPVNELTKPCTTTGYRFVGPVLVIDTLPGECQMMIVAHVGRKRKHMLKRLNRKGLPKKPRKEIMFEYIDEAFF